jgi:cytoskeletal protein CcmA (bactofilin family)
LSTETIVGADTTFTGQVRGERLNVLGTFEGEATLKSTLTVGPQGRVKATVQAETVEVRGEFEGEIGARSLVFGETARAKGVFRAERLTIREGAVVNGQFGRDTPPSRPAAAAAPAPAPAKPTEA